MASSNVDGSSPSEQVKFKRALGLWDGVAVIVGVIVGSGIFVSPKGVLDQAGSVGASLAVWTLSGLLALLGALCFSELGTSIANSGGEYTYIKLAYGPLPAFLYLWVLVLVITPCGNAISALTFANYVLQPLYDGGTPPDHAIRLTALALLLILVYVNCRSVSLSVKLQGSFTLAKISALILIIAYGLYFIFTGRADHLEPSGSIWSGTQSSLPHLAQAFYAGFYTYSGWNSLNCVTEELKDPIKNMPRAIIISISAVTLIYILTNTAYFAVLTKTEILEAPAIAVLFGQKTLTFAKWLMPIAVALSTMSGLNASIFAASRIFYAGAREGQLFSALQMINIDYLTPIPSLIFLGFLSALYLSTTEILSLINYTTFVEASFSALAVSTVLTLRFKFKDIARPIKINLFIPIIYLVISITLIVLPIWTSPVETSIGLLITFIGLPVYFLTARWKRKPRAYQNALDKLNQICQFLTMSVAAGGELKLNQ